MPPKSLNKKGNSQPFWYHCDKCNVYITYKSKDNHEQDCPILNGITQTSKGKALEYIHNGVFYTASIEKRKFEIELLNEMPRRYIDNMIFVSEDVIRLAGWRIGQYMIIRNTQSKEVPLIRILWPISEKFLSTIFANETDFDLYWLTLKGKNEVLQIQSVNDNQIEIARTIHLQVEKMHDKCDVSLSKIQLKDIGRLLKLELKDCCFAINSHIYYNFFNKCLNLKVEQWIGFNEKTNIVKNESLLEKSFENLSLNSTLEDKLCKVTNITIIEIYYCDVNEQKTFNESLNYMTKLEDIGGLKEQLDFIEETMDLALGIHKVPKGIKVSRGILLYGSSGCGKTMICEAMCNNFIKKFKTSLNPLIVKLDTSELFSKYLGETDKNLALYFQQIYCNYPQPTLMIIEDVHILCSKYEKNEMMKRVAAAFVHHLDMLNNRLEASKSFVLATTGQIDLLNNIVRRCGRFDCEVEIPVPSPKERFEILQRLLNKIPDNVDLQSETIRETAQVTHGFVGADLANLVREAFLRSFKMRNSRLKPDVLLSEDLQAALIKVKPSAMREVLIECPNIKWDDIGGQDSLKLKLKQAIEWPFKYNEQFQRLGIKAPRGILMYGPPGCSKTMIAKALATESQLNFISIKGPELFSMWVGESERAVREVFRKARQVAPSIVFFDEIDAISGGRCNSNNSNSVQERVLTQLLTEMDGVESLNNVTIVAATNRPDMIDKALLRPGRIDRIIYVGLPDTAARREIFQIKLRRMPISHDVDLDELVRKTEGYSGAEIQAVCQEAALKALHVDQDTTEINWSYFQYALQVVQPRTSPDLLDLYEKYAKNS